MTKRGNHATLIVKLFFCNSKVLVVDKSPLQSPMSSYMYVVNKMYMIHSLSGCFMTYSIDTKCFETTSQH